MIIIHSTKRETVCAALLSLSLISVDRSFYVPREPLVKTSLHSIHGSSHCRLALTLVELSQHSFEHAAFFRQQRVATLCDAAWFVSFLGVRSRFYSISLSDLNQLERVMSLPSATVVGWLLRSVAETQSLLSIAIAQNRGTLQPFRF